MKKLRENAGLKITALVLALVFGAAGFWSSYMTLYYWDDLWSARGYFNSTSCYAALAARRNLVEELVQLRQQEVWSGKSTYLERQEIARLTGALSAEKTNFRFTVRNADAGALLEGNLTGASLADEVVSLHTYSFGFTHDTDENGQPLEGESQQTAAYVLEFGVVPDLTVADEFRAGQQNYAETRRWLPAMGVLALVCDGVFSLLLVFLCSAVGQRKEDDHRIFLTFIDRIPTDLFALMVYCAILLLINAGSGIAWAFHQGASARTLVGMGLISLSVCWVAVSAILSVSVRLKAHTLWRSCILWRLVASLLRVCKTMFFHWSMAGRTVLLFLVYLAGSLLTAFTVVLAVPYQCLTLFLLCRWVIQWRAIRTATTAILGGDSTQRIPTEKMYPDLKEHAAQLNDLGSAVSHAVDERMKSERFKAELITNVSHDLKTPLTSIISYVDLLKLLPIENPQAVAYIEVLDRKSQRLKKLTEDLVDASKASTGNLTVNLERLGMVQLVVQALGEYEEKFSEKGLEVIFAPPAEELYLCADGRHLWRVIDNLFSNCYKYALEGTRIYLEVRARDGGVFLSVKNISKQALNVPPEQLMERFVRGEESRTTEGSGLGLSIARSLVELQGGTFRLEIDGDLFKATLSLPLAAALPPEGDRAAL